MIYGKKTRFCAIAVGLLSFQVAMADTNTPINNDPMPTDNTQSAALTTVPISGNGVASASYTSPNAFGSGYDIFLNFQRTPFWTGMGDTNGGMDVGANVGNPFRYVGATIYTNMSSLSFNNSFLSSGMAAARINRYFDKNTAMAIGVQNIVSWGSYQHTANTYYAVVTHVFPMKMPLTINGGFGTGALNSPEDFNDGIDTSLRPFFSIGLGLLYNLSLLADYTTNQISLGAVYNFTLFTIPFFANMGITNITQTNNNGTDFQCGLGAAYIFAA